LHIATALFSEREREGKEGENNNATYVKCNNVPRTYVCVRVRVKVKVSHTGKNWGHSNAHNL